MLVYRNFSPDRPLSGFSLLNEHRRRIHSMPSPETVATIQRCPFSLESLSATPPVSVVTSSCWHCKDKRIDEGKKREKEIMNRKLGKESRGGKDRGKLGKGEMTGVKWWEAWDKNQELMGDQITFSPAFFFLHHTAGWGWRSTLLTL